MKKLSMVLSFAALFASVTVFSSFSEAPPIGSAQCQVYCEPSTVYNCVLTIVGGEYDGFSYTCYNQQVKGTGSN